MITAIATSLSERLADVFRTANVGTLFTNDVFLDGNPPLWRFQLRGVGSLQTWLSSYAPDGVETEIVRTIGTETGFVSEFTGRQEHDECLTTDRKIVLCEVRAGRIAELTIYCSGDWDDALRARHRAETTLLRP